MIYIYIHTRIYNLYNHQMLGKWWLTMIRHENWNVSMASADRFCHSQGDHMPKSNQRQGTHFHCKFFRKNLTMWSVWWCNNNLEKYESQLGWLFPIYGKIKKMFETTNQWYFGAVDGCGKMWMAMWTAAPRNHQILAFWSFHFDNLELVNWRCQHVPHVRSA